jgi:hypothetical protein
LDLRFAFVIFPGNQARAEESLEGRLDFELEEEKEEENVRLR